MASGWQQHLDFIMVRSEKAADKAALIYPTATAGSRVVANTDGFTISDHEIEQLVNIFETEEAKNDAFANGFDIANEHYKTLRIVDRSIYGKLGKCGVSIARTTSLLIVAHYDETIPAGANVVAVEGLADHLVASNY